jgi:hypothetical protein
VFTLSRSTEIEHPGLVARAPAARGSGGCMTVTLTFHGGAGTVTGSRHLLEASGQRWLVDAGVFQGL